MTSQAESQHGADDTSRPFGRSLGTSPVRVERCQVCAAIGVIDRRRTFEGPDGRLWPYHHGCRTAMQTFIDALGQDYDPEAPFRRPASTDPPHP